MTVTSLPENTLIPSSPVVSPSISKPRSVTSSPAAAVTMIPFVPETRTPPLKGPLSIVMALLMVTAPKPPGSRTLISPCAAVFEMAPANVLQGAVRLHGLASSPTPDTQVRDACAWAMDAKANVKIAIANALIVSRNLFIWSLLFLSVEVLGWPPAEHGSVPATVAPSLPIVAEKCIFIKPLMIPAKITDCEKCQLPQSLAVRLVIVHKELSPQLMTVERKQPS